MMSSLKSAVAILLVAGIFVVGCTSNKSEPAKDQMGTDQNAPVQTSKLEKDVVCGMGVNPEAPDTQKAEYKGKAYYFCSEMCKKTFEADPEKYTQAMGASDSHEMQMQE